MKAMRRFVAVLVVMFAATGVGLACGSFSGNDSPPGDASAEGSVSPGADDGGGDASAIHDAGANRWDCEGVTYRWDLGKELVPSWIAQESPGATYTAFETDAGNFGRFTQTFSTLMDGGAPPSSRYDVDFLDAGTTFICASMRVRTLVPPTGTDIVEEMAGGFFQTDQAVGVAQYAAGATQAGAGFVYARPDADASYYPLTRIAGDLTAWHVVRLEMQREDGGMRLTYFVDGQRVASENPFPPGTLEYGVVGIGTKPSSTHGSPAATVDIGDLRIDWR